MSGGFEMNKKEGLLNVNVIINLCLFILLGFILTVVAVDSIKEKQVQPITYNTVITNPYPECVKGYCSMEGFKCLDEPQKPFTIDDSTCVCTEKGYECERK